MNKFLNGLYAGITSFHYVEYSEEQANSKLFGFGLAIGSIKIVDVAAIIFYISATYKLITF